MKQRYDEEGFEDFLMEVKDNHVLEGAAKGILEKVLDEGLDSLVGDQRRVFDKYVVEQHYVERCSLCDNCIPWSEMFYASVNGGYCGSSACVDFRETIRKIKTRKFKIVV